MNIHITAWIIPLIPVTMSIGFGLIPTATIKSSCIHIQYGLFISCIHIPSFSYCCLTFKCIIAMGFSANFSIQQIHRSSIYQYLGSCTIGIFPQSSRCSIMSINTHYYSWNHGSGVSSLFATLSVPDSLVLLLNPLPLVTRCHGRKHSYLGSYTRCYYERAEQFSCSSTSSSFHSQ